MMQEHKYTLADIENMLPWERIIYVSLLIQHMKKQAERLAQG